MADENDYKHIGDDLQGVIITLDPGEAVVAEVQSMLDTSVSLMDTLSQLGIRYDPVGEAAAMRAGHMNRRFRARGGKRDRVVADFLVGAHALLQCDALITRDAGFFRDFFKGLKVIEPTAP